MGVDRRIVGRGLQRRQQSPTEFREQVRVPGRGGDLGHQLVGAAGDRVGPVVAEQDRQTLFDAPEGDRLVGGDHQLLDDDVGDGPEFGGDRHDGPVLVGRPAAGEVVEGEGPAVAAGGQQGLCGRIRRDQLGMQRMCRVGQDGGHLGVINRHAPTRRNLPAADGDIDQPTAGRDRAGKPQTGPHGFGTQGGSLLRRLAEHRNGAAAQIPRLRPQERLLVGDRPQFYDVGDAGNMNLHRPPAATGERGDGEGVVPVPGGRRIDHQQRRHVGDCRRCHGRRTPLVLPASDDNQSSPGAVSDAPLEHRSASSKPASGTVCSPR